MEDNFWTELIQGADNILQGYVKRQDGINDRQRAEEFARNQQMTAITAQMASANTAYDRNSIQNMMQQALEAGVDPQAVLNRNGAASGISGATASPNYAPPLPTVADSVMTNRNMLQQERQNDIQLLLGLRNVKNLDDRLKHDIESALRDYVENVRKNKTDENIRFADLELRQQQYQESVDQFRQSLDLQFKQLEQNKSIENNKLNYQYAQLKQQAEHFVKQMDQQMSMFGISEANKQRLQTQSEDFQRQQLQLHQAFEELMNQGNKDFQREMAELQSKLRIAEYQFQAFLRFRQGSTFIKSKNMRLN